jgi:hypothetical protein
MTRPCERIPLAASTLLAVFLATTIVSSLRAQVPAEAPVAPSMTALTDTGWPRIIAGKGAKIIIYQPQIDSWNGFELEARAAVAVTPTGAADKPPTYGIVKVTAHACRQGRRPGHAGKAHGQVSVSSWIGGQGARLGVDDSGRIGKSAADFARALRVRRRVDRGAAQGRGGAGQERSAAD